MADTGAVGNNSCSIFRDGWGPLTTKQHAPDSSDREALEHEIAAEQIFVDRAYTSLEQLRADYREMQRSIESEGAWGSPQARTERDAKAAHFGDQAMRLEQIEDRLVFGRIDMTDNQAHYIGRAGLPDEAGGRLLIDWRAPAARPFYQATAANPEGVVRRRHIATSNRKVRSIEDDALDTATAPQRGLVFQGEGALMSALASGRDGRMGDIVATIQSEQDSIIRAPGRGVLVVQGGPGTGKTAVALHRAAYLLYADRKRLERSGVLIVGPSRVFLKYIEQVLPSLGESGVVSLTMGELVPGVTATINDPPDVAHAKGKLAWIETLRAAVRDLQRLPKVTKEFRIDGQEAVLTVERVDEARARARRSGKPHNVAREAFALELVEEVTRQLAGDDADPETLDWWRDSVRAAKDIRREINLCWMPTTAETLLRRLYARPEVLARVARGLNAQDRALVKRPLDSEMTTQDVPLLDELEELLGTSDVLAQRQSNDQRRKEQEEIERVRAAMEGQNLGEGIVSAELLADRARGEREWTPLAERALGDRTWTYGHVVVDEAQDLQPMAWHALLRRCPSRSFTVVGDLDQARGHRRPSSWFDALGPAAKALEDERALTISYRSPAAILEVAQDVLAQVHEPVAYPLTSARELPDCLADTFVASTNAPSPIAPRSEDPLWETVQSVLVDELQILDEQVGVGSGRIGVIVGNERGRAWNADTEGWEALDERVAVLSAVGAKGLEFDTTVLVEPMEILGDGPGDLFVAMTRSTRRLHSVRTSELPDAWTQAIRNQGRETIDL